MEREDEASSGQFRTLRNNKVYDCNVKCPKRQRCFESLDPYYASMQEMCDFNLLIDNLYKRQLQYYGAVKVIPPSEWKQPKFEKKWKNVLGKVINAVEEFRFKSISNKDIFQMIRRQCGLTEFRKAWMANYKRELNEKVDVNRVREKYWSSLSKNECGIYYGDSNEGTFFDPKVAPEQWTLSTLGTLLDQHESVPGLHTPFLYFGMKHSSFVLHTEDHDLGSISYNHFGAPKMWYVICPSNNAHFKAILDRHMPISAGKCPNYLRHKSTIVCPGFLKLYRIKFYEIEHNPGEFIITFPNAYHGGYNCGANIAEAVNFATKQWLEVVKKSDPCVCVPPVLDLNVFGIDTAPITYSDRNKVLTLIKRSPELDWCKIGQMDAFRSILNSKEVNWVRDKQQEIDLASKRMMKKTPQKKCISCPGRNFYCYKVRGVFEGSKELHRCHTCYNREVYVPRRKERERAY